MYLLYALSPKYNPMTKNTVVIKTLMFLRILPVLVVVVDIIHLGRVVASPIGVFLLLLIFGHDPQPERSSEQESGVDEFD